MQYLPSEAPMNFLSDYGMFLLKIITLAAAILIVAAGLFSLSRKTKQKPSIQPLNQDYEDLRKTMTKEVMGEKFTKRKKSKDKLPRLFVLEFHGDIKASQVEQLREEITMILTVARPEDEVVVKIESPGGAVNGYGLAASQLQRLREAKIPLTACIDRVAASGGYLMAAVANQILAAPFAIVGSIGVVAQIPNFYRWLQKHNIDVELMTAGEFKRTLTLLGQNTEKGRKKFQEDLEKIHLAFRQAVLSGREAIKIDEVATGEHWLATDAFELGLVDRLVTSDDYLLSKMQTHEAFKIQLPAKTSVLEKLLKPAARLFHPWAHYF